MIRRAQAEALLKLAEALEECERQGVTVGANADRDQCVFVNGRKVYDTRYSDLTPMRVRLAVNALVPKSEQAE